MSVEVGLFLDGLHCTGCVNRTERALRDAPGVEDAQVNYTNHRAFVRFDEGATTPERLVAVVEELGYHASPFDPRALERPDATEARRALVRLLVAAFLAMNVMWIAVSLYIGEYQGMDPATRTALRWVAIALSLPAIGWCALPFWRGALSGLRRRELTIDVPVVLGMTTAFAASVAGTWANVDHLFMDSAAVIVFLILLGRTLERRARARASDAVEHLAALTPPRALRREGDRLEPVEPAELRPGDRIVVPAGEHVPVDALVTSGSSELDESAFTGESLPVLRAAGDRVTGGTRNLTGQLEAEVVAAIDAGALARLASLLERAQLARPRLQRQVDRVAAVFAPAVLLVAAGTAAFGWLRGAAALEIMLSTAAVLIVACPCALGLATPAAITAAIGRAARFGILVKRGDALERLAGVDTAILDKTGTLTEGRFQIEAVETAAGVAPPDLLEVALAAEGASTHPMAEAIRLAAAARGVIAAPPEERQTRPGQGVVARCGDATLRVGSRSLLAEARIPIAASLASRVAALAERGFSIAWVARDDVVLGAIAAWDRPREDAAQAVHRLVALGVAPILVTGDHEQAARHAGLAAGLDRIFAEAAPDQKVELVQKRRAHGGHVLAVGDGVNDAAALAAADVGIAMSRGSDVTLHAADLVVQAPRLGAIPDAIELARATFARVRENLGFALLYNLVAVPLAVAGVLEPLHAALAMSASSVVVTLNALRLLRFDPSR